MKKYILLFIAIIVFGAFYFYINGELQIHEPIRDSNFVQLNSGKFTYKNEPFFPLALNYIVAVNYINGDLFISPSHNYNFNKQFNYFNKDSADVFLDADFKLIKSCGFNTVRIVGASELRILDESKGQLLLNSFVAHEIDSFINITNPELYGKYLSAIEKTISIADSCGLKVILLNGINPDSKISENHFAKVASAMSGKTGLMAYDLFNEPLYFDSLEREKTEVIKITRRWKKLARTNCPKQLITIGLEGIREIFKWDPNFVDVDFISFHPYEYELDQVRSALYWYGKYVNKPWMVGETSLPADNDSVPYSEQSEFAERTFNQAVNCGAIGYSWWQFRDVKWGQFHSDFMGIMSDQGDTIVDSISFHFQGNLKPVAEKFKKFDLKKLPGDCVKPGNYYNHSMGKVFKITGKVLDDSQKPIEGAIVMGWDKPWLSCYHTFTKADGSFELRSTFILFHYRVSATRYSREMGDIPNKNAVMGADGIPANNIGTFILHKLQ